MNEYFAHKKEKCKIYECSQISKVNLIKHKVLEYLLPLS